MPSIHDRYAYSRCDLASYFECHETAGSLVFGSARTTGRRQQPHVNTSAIRYFINNRFINSRCQTFDVMHSIPSTPPGRVAYLVQLLDGQNSKYLDCQDDGCADFPCCGRLTRASWTAHCSFEARDGEKKALHEKKAQVAHFRVCSFSIV